VKHLTRQGKIALRAGRANARLCLRRYVSRMGMRIANLLCIITSSVFASDLTFKKPSKPPVKHEKFCLERDIPKHKAMFYKSELCEFGALSCEESNLNGPFEVFCDNQMVTECYSEKAWKSSNQLFELDPSYSITNISTSMAFSNGKKTTTICAHYK